MADRPIDPLSLTGEALRRWYSRSPAEVEEERQARRDQRYRDFFEDRADPDPEIGQISQKSGRDIDPGFSRGVGSAGRDIDPGFAWVPVSPNRWRRQPLRADGMQPLSVSTADAGGAVVDRGLAGPDDAGELMEIGNPHNPRLKNEYIKKYGFWPKTEDGRDHVVSHRRAIADGGTNTLDNIEPMHPDEHTAMHRDNGDAARWARRGWIARAFGGRVEPPTPGARLNGLGWLGLIPDITGVLSGRIRTDTPQHFWYDMSGVPAPDDQSQQVDPVCRSMGITTPGWKCT
jgi:hypothetical protein